MQSIGNRENMEKWLFQVSCPESMDCFIGFSPQETIDFPIFIWGVPFQKNPPTTNPSPLSVLILQCCRVALGDDDLRKQQINLRWLRCWRTHPTEVLVERCWLTTCEWSYDHWPGCPMHSPERSFSFFGRIFG